ncbi:Rhodanese-like domain-containing protein [Scheffersomyces xylosifermentans]|uniref:Rhodanese-like domain-containing protein n=1 Tax=Scheffersomyces xylosifermentans TaxID=1304137 RepID=UPI00315D3C45
MGKIYSLSDLKYIKPTALRSWFNEGSPHGKGKFAVVDVRDSDFVGGHIKDCYHYPAGNFTYTLPELQERLASNEIDDVVFHCALSQVRGPSSTLKFLRSLDEIKDPVKKAQLDSLHVWVLNGGFTKWQEKYGEDTEVTHHYDKEIWQFGGL